MLNERAEKKLQQKKKIKFQCFSWKINLIYLQFSLPSLSLFFLLFPFFASWRLNGCTSKLKRKMKTRKTDSKFTVLYAFDNAIVGEKKMKINSMNKKNQRLK